MAEQSPKIQFPCGWFEGIRFDSGHLTKSQKRILSEWMNDEPIRRVITLK